MGDIFALAAIAEGAAMLASHVRVSAVARPEPVVGALALVEDRFRLVADEACALAHHSPVRMQEFLAKVRFHEWTGSSRYV